MFPQKSNNKENPAHFIQLTLQLTLLPTIPFGIAHIGAQYQLLFVFVLLPLFSCKRDSPPPLYLLLFAHLIYLIDHFRHLCL